jgi:hypothetical protein
MPMTPVITAPPQLTVIDGRREVGLVDLSLLTDNVGKSTWSFWRALSGTDCVRRQL